MPILQPVWQIMDWMAATLLSGRLLMVLVMAMMVQSGVENSLWRIMQATNVFFTWIIFLFPVETQPLKRPARTALALLWHLGLEWDEKIAPVRDLCYEERLALHIQLERGLNSPQTSSLGRLFDAAAALAGVRQMVNYEAQAAVEFEAALDPQETGAYHFDIRGKVIDTREAIQNLLADVTSGVSIPRISARFHNGLAEMAQLVCTEIRNQTGIREVALSGGVWQNMALLEKTTENLRREGFMVYIHHQVPANDGGLSLGQAMVGATKIGV